MENQILDSNLVDKNHKPNPFTLIGIGIFLWLTIRGITYFLGMILKDVFVLINIPHLVNYIVVEMIGLLLIIIGFSIFLRKAKLNYFNSQKSTRSLFRILIFLFILSQALQVIVAYFGYDILPENFLDKKSEYYTAINEKAQYSLFEIVIELIEYIYVGWVFYTRKE